MTQGRGETLFSSRGGTIFGYRILWVFLAVSFLKWVLAHSGMRHMILSDGHPMYRWRGRLPVRKIRAVAIVWCLGGEVVVLWGSLFYLDLQRRPKSMSSDGRTD